MTRAGTSHLIEASRQQPSYLGRSQYLAAHFAIDEEDATNYRSPRAGRGGLADDLRTQIRHTVSSAGVPRGPLRQSLLKNFRRLCHPWMPLVDEADLERLDAQQGDSLLVTSILVAGSIVSSTTQAAEVGQLCYQRAKVLFYTGAEDNNLHVVMATIFLQWLNPSGPEHVSIDSSSFWLRISVALAHQMGLHREPDPRMPDARLRRRIWWTLVSRDNQIAASHGRPRAINVKDSNVRPLRRDDFAPDEEDPFLFTHFVRITSVLGDLTEHCCRASLSDWKKVEIETHLIRWLQEVPESLRLFDPGTGRARPYDFKSRQLHIPYFVALMMLFRQDTPSQPPSPVSSLAASFVSGIYEEYLAWEDMCHLPPTSTFYLLVAALVQLSYHRFTSMAGARSQEIEIVTMSLNELKKRFPTALGTERVINQAMKHATTLPVSGHPWQTTLSPTQRELFAPFGPDLCRQWSVILDRQGENDASGTATRPKEPIRSEPDQQRSDNKGPSTLWNGSPGQQPADAPESIWEDPFSIGGEGSAPLDLTDLDSIGRWWWADWMPEAEPGLLSKPL